MKGLNKKLAFTLIELLVVIVILGILASLTMVGLSSVRSKSRDAKRISDVKQMQTALEMYYTDNNSYPTALVSNQPLMDLAGTKTYMAKIPANPVPWSEGSCSSGSNYTYATTSSGYALSYCIANNVNEVSAGNCTAVPGNICGAQVVASPWSTTVTQTASGARNWRGLGISADGQKIIASAYDDYIYTSADSGVTWAARTNAGTSRWIDVASSADGTKLYAIANSDPSTKYYAYRSADSGATWSTNSLFGLKWWYSVASSDDGATQVYSYWVAGAAISLDSGVTITAKSVVSSNGSPVAISQNGTTMVLADTTAGGTIFLSSNAFASYVVLNNAGGHPWTNLALANNGTTILAAYNAAAQMRLSTNSGTTWTDIGPTGKTWYSVDISSDGRVIVGTVYGDYIYISEDYGATWSTIASAGTANWTKIKITHDGTFIVVQEANSYIHTIRR